MRLTRGLCIVIASLGFMAFISPIFWPGTSPSDSSVLGAVMLVGGAAAFEMLGRLRG